VNRTMPNLHYVTCQKTRGFWLVNFIHLKAHSRRCRSASRSCQHLDAKHTVCSSFDDRHRRVWPWWCRCNISHNGVAGLIQLSPDFAILDVIFHCLWFISCRSRNHALICSSGSMCSQTLVRRQSALVLLHPGFDLPYAPRRPRASGRPPRPAHQHAAVPTSRCDVRGRYRSRCLAFVPRYDRRAGVEAPAGKVEGALSHPRLQSPSSV